MSKLVSSVLFLIGLAAAAAAGWWLFAKDDAAAQGGGRPPYMLAVTLAAVERGELAPRATLTGTVLSAQHARVGFDVAGRIAEVALDAGAEVAAGALLAKLDPRDAEVALRRARAAEAAAERELERWLSGARDEEKRRLAAELAVRAAEADLAAKAVERGRGLVGEQIISQNDFDALEATRVAADARVVSAREGLAQAEAGSRPEEIAVQRAQVEWRRSEVAIAERELDKTVLRAPFAAAVVARSAALGDSVQPGQAVFELVDMSLREVEVEIPASLATRLGRQPRVTLALEAYAGFTLATDLDVVVAAADERSRSFRGLIRLAPGEDVEQRLKPGMFVRVEVQLEPLRDALIVPTDAVRTTANGTLVVKAAPVAAPAEAAPQAGSAPAAAAPLHPGAGPPLAAQWVPVRVLATEGERCAVEALGAELAAGDRVVVIGVDLAFPNAPLFVREAGAAAGGGAQH